MQRTCGSGWSCISQLFAKALRPVGVSCQPMIAENPFQWTDPHTWPWFVYFWLMAVLAGWVPPLWRWLRRQQAHSWPSANGRIESTSVEKKRQFFPFNSSRNGSLPYVADLAYSYSVAGEMYATHYRKEFPTRAEAEEFIRDLEHRPVTVVYNPQNPHKSTLLDEEIQQLQESRPPGEFRFAAGEIPSWWRPLLWPFIALSAVGLALSLWVHLGAVMGRKPEPFFWVLHVGIFVVWFPAVYVANRRLGNTNRRDFWKAVLRGSPTWVKYVVYGVFGYALLNSFIFIPQGWPGKSSGGDTPAVVWRYFSAGWMLFYSVAMAILYAAVHRPPRSVIEPPAKAL